MTRRPFASPAATPLRFGAASLVAGALLDLGLTHYKVAFMPGEGAVFAACIILGCVFSAALSRVTKRFPGKNTVFRLWLETTPWEHPQPLPFGDVRIRWRDLVDFLAFAVMLWVALAMLGRGRDAVEKLHSMRGAMALLLLCAGLLVLTLYFAVYNYLLWRTLDSQSAAYRVASILIPTTLYLWFFPLGSAAVFVALTVLLQWGHVQSLKRIPWDNPDWSRTLGQQTLAHAHRWGGFGALQKLIGPPDVNAEPDKSVGRTLLDSATVAWWVYVPVAIFVAINSSADWRDWVNTLTYGQAYAGRVPVELWPAAVCMAFPGVVALKRFGRYKFGGYGSPISVWNRIRYFRCIIPEHDQVYVGPFCVVVVGLFNGLALHALGVPDALLLFMHIFLVLATSGLVGPSLERWHFVGFWSATRSVREADESTMTAEPSEAGL